MFRFNPERLADVSRFLKLKITKEKDLQEIVELAAEICGSTIAMITLMDGETQFVRAATGVKIEQVQYTDTFCQFTLNQKEVLVIPDASQDERLAGNPFVHNGPNLRFYAGVPLTTEKGNAIGTLCVFNTASRDLDALERTMLSSLSSQVTHLLEFDMTHQILKEQYDEALAATNTLHTYFQSSSSAHLLLDKEMSALAFNQSMITLLYANHGAYLKEGMRIDEYIHPEFKSEFFDYFNRAIAGEKITIEKKLTYASQQICWLLNFEAACDTDGVCIGVSFNATDVTKNIHNQDRVLLQLDALNKIDYLHVNEILDPIDQILLKTNALKQLISIEDHHVDEIEMLFSSVSELADKKVKIAEVTAPPASIAQIIQK